MREVGGWGRLVVVHDDGSRLKRIWCLNFKGAVGFSNQMICFVPLFFLPSQFLNSINELADQCCWQRE